jgi:hypothetical protein
MSNNTVEQVHELKIWPEYFDDVESGAKTFEVRKLDRLFGKGDTLWLREWSPVKGYSGRETRKVITYVMAGGQWGLAEGNCILGIRSSLPHEVEQRAGIESVGEYASGCVIQSLQEGAKSAERMFTLDDMKAAIRFGAERANDFCGLPSEIAEYIAEKEAEYFNKEYGLPAPPDSPR